MSRLSFYTPNKLLAPTTRKFVTQTFLRVGESDNCGIIPIASRLGITMIESAARTITGRAGFVQGRFFHLGPVTLPITQTKKRNNYYGFDVCNPKFSFLSSCHNRLVESWPVSYLRDFFLSTVGWPRKTWKTETERSPLLDTRVQM